MCGIAGIINFNEEPIDKAVIKKMTDVIYHRGPDDDGIYAKKNVGLGHRRLSIIDLSERGHQPMSNEDESIWIIFNGEIYNYKELNQHLRSKGHRFRSNCDTETIIHLYEEEGIECVNKLRGMFSFAIWDSNKQQLFAAVDRLRIKPFYYTIADNQLVFASELKAILRSELIQPKINFAAVHHYFSLQAIPVPQTIFENIFTLPGGYYLVAKEDSLSVNQYWDIPFPDKEQKDEKTIKKELFDLFQESVEIRLMSDVPLGAFLSGGIDSSAVVGVMKNMQRGPVRTFSIGYDVGGQDWDDTYYARLVSRKYKTDHVEQRVTANDILSELKNFVWHLDQPSTDAINSYFVSKLAAKDVTVVLCGQGGDELFAGYRTFDLMNLFLSRDEKWDRIPYPVRASISTIFSHLPGSLRSFSFNEKISKFLDNYGSFVKKFALIRMEVTEKEKSQLYSEYFRERINGADTLAVYDRYYQKIDGHYELADQITYLELKMHLGDILMRDVDVMSMAFSLETRVPIIDQKLVEYAMTIPQSIKLKDGIKKYILIEAMKDILPEEVIKRKKLGFAFPFNIWLREDLKPLVEFVLSERTIKERGFFKYEEVEKLKRNFYDNRRLTYRKVWGLIILELWMRQVIDNDLEYFDELQTVVSAEMRKK